MTQPTREPLPDPPRNRWVRPYVLTRGRTRAPLLHVHTLVAGVGGNERAYLEGLLPEARALYERSLVGVESVAELSAYCEIPLGVTRVLLTDLASDGRLRINPETTSAFDVSILERVLDGLRQLT